MPKIDAEPIGMVWCSNCNEFAFDHANGKCLYEFSYLKAACVSFVDPSVDKAIGFYCWKCNAKYVENYDQEFDRTRGVIRVCATCNTPVHVY